MEMEFMSAFPSALANHEDERGGDSEDATNVVICVTPCALCKDMHEDAIFFRNSLHQSKQHNSSWLQHQAPAVSAGISWTLGLYL